MTVSDSEEHWDHVVGATLTKLSTRVGPLQGLAIQWEKWQGGLYLGARGSVAQRERARAHVRYLRLRRITRTHPGLESDRIRSPEERWG